MISKVQKGIPFTAITSEVHPRFSLSFNFFKTSYQETFNNERFLIQKAIDQELYDHYTSLNQDHNSAELDQLMLLFKSHFLLFKSMEYEKRLLINTAFVNNFEYFKERNLAVTLKILSQIFLIRTNIVRREWITHNEEAVMEKIYTFVKGLVNENQAISTDRLFGLIWLFRDWDLVNKIFSNVAQSSYADDNWSVRELFNVLIFYVKYTAFSVNYFVNKFGSRYLWILLTPLLMNGPQLRNSDFLFPVRANIQAFGAEYMGEVERAMDTVKRYGTAFTIKESATYFRFFSEFQKVEISLLQSLLDHVYRSLMAKEVPTMRFHLIDIICNLPRLQMEGLRVPDHYYIFLYKAIIGSPYLIFLDLPKSCLEYLEMINLPDHIKKIVIKVFLLNQRLPPTILRPFENLSRIYSDASITIDYSPIEYPDAVPQSLMGVTDFNIFNVDFRCLAAPSEDPFPQFRLMEGKSEEEVLEQLSMAIDILSTKISIKSRLTCLGYVIYLARYNPSFVREYLDSRNSSICPFNSMIYTRQFVQHFYMLSMLTGDQVLCLWLFFSKCSDKLFGLLDMIDFMFSIKVIKVTNHQGYEYLNEIFESLRLEFSRLNQQIFEAVFMFTCWTGFFQSGARQPKVSSFYNLYLENLSMSLATQPHYITYIRFILKWLQEQNELSPDNKFKFSEILDLTDEEIELRKTELATTSRLFYRENVNIAMNQGRYFAMNFMCVEGMNLTYDDLDETMRQRMRKQSKWLNLDMEEFP